MNQLENFKEFQFFMFGLLGYTWYIKKRNIRGKTSE